MYRQIRLAPSPGAGRQAALAIALFEKTTALPPEYAALDRRFGGLLAAAIQRSEFSAAKGVVSTLYPAPPKQGEEKKTRRSSVAWRSEAVPQRIFVLGLGEREKFNPEALRIAAARLLRTAFAARLPRLRLHLLPGLEKKLDAVTAGRAVGDGVTIANFEFDTFKGVAGRGGARKESQPLDLALEAEPTVRPGLERSLRIGQSVNLARTLAATPPNVAHPQYLAAYARRMARQVGLSCTIIDPRRAAKLKMGGLLAVGSAGSHPPAMIVLEWKGSRRGSASAAGPVLLVGKAITFDSGGISIKPADNMDKMKYDKCGGMAVLGAMHAIASLKLPVHVVGLVPTAENMLGEKAYRPADILTHANGVTSEIINTDAEGRLVLADALAYGTAVYKPQAVIDLATLTGACVVALGTVCAGAFCGDSNFRSHLFDAADFTGERLWHMPLWEEHRQQIKGTHGDILNAGGREAGASTAAAFLSFFIEPDGPRKLPELPWCHLDIAGVADVKTDTPLYAKGPTGFGVRLLVRALETWPRSFHKRQAQETAAASGLEEPKPNGAPATPVGVPVDKG